MEEVRHALEFLHGIQVAPELGLNRLPMDLPGPNLLRMEHHVQRQVELSVGRRQCLPSRKHCLRLYPDVDERIPRLGAPDLHEALQVIPPNQCDPSFHL